MDNDQKNKHIIRLRQGAQEKTIYLAQDVFVFGRGAESTIRTSSQAVSDQHLQVRIEGENVIVRDMGSMHGTFLGGQRLVPNEDVMLGPSGSELFLANVIGISITPAAVAARLTTTNDAEEVIPRLAVGGARRAYTTINPSSPRSAEKARLSIVPNSETGAGTPGAGTLDVKAMTEAASRFSQVLREETRREAQSILAEADARRREVESSRIEHETALVTLRNQIESLQTEKARVDQEIIQVRRHHKSLEIALSELEVEKQERERELLQFHGLRTEVDREVQALKSQITSLKEETLSKEHEVRQCLAEIAELQGTITELRQSVVEAREEIRRETEIAQSEQRRHQAEEEVLAAEFRAKHMALEEILAKLEAQKSSMEREIYEVNRRKAMINEECESYRRANERQAEIAAEHLRSIDAEAKKMQESIELQQKKQDQLRLEITEQHNVIHELVAEREQIAIDVQVARDKFEELQRQFNDQNKRLEFESSELKTHIDELVARRGKLQKERDDALDEIAKDQDKGRARLREIEGEVRHFHMQLEAEKTESDRLRAQVEQGREILTGIEAQRDRVRSEIDTIRDEKARLESSHVQDVARIQDEIRDLEAKRDRMQFQLEEQQKRVDFEIESKQKLAEAELEREILKQKESQDRALAEAKAAFENDIEQTRKRESEEITKIRKDQERADKARKKHIADEIVRATLELSKGTALQGHEEKLRALVQAGLDGKTSATLSAKADARTRRFWKNVGVIASVPLSIAAILTLFPNLPSVIGNKLEKKVATEKKEAGGVFLQEIKERGQMFQPAKMDRNYRDTYADNILYLEGYVDMKTNEDKQKEWTLLLNDFIVGRLGLSDRTIPDFIAAESVMVRSLIDARGKIVMQFKDQGLQRLADTEKKDSEKLLNLLQTPENYKKFRDLEKSFYEEYISSKDAAKRKPAATASVGAAAIPSAAASSSQTPTQSPSAAASSSTK